MFSVFQHYRLVFCKNKIISTTYTIIFRIRFPVYCIIYQYGTRVRCVLSIALSFLLNVPILPVPMERILQRCSAAFLLPGSSFRRCQFCMQNYGTFSRIHYSIITQFLVQFHTQTSHSTPWRNTYLHHSSDVYSADDLFPLRASCLRRAHCSVP